MIGQKISNKKVLRSGAGDGGADGGGGGREESWASSSVWLDLEFMNNRFTYRREISQDGWWMIF